MIDFLIKTEQGFRIPRLHEFERVGLLSPRLLCHSNAADVINYFPSSISTHIQKDKDYSKACFSAYSYILRELSSDPEVVNKFKSIKNLYMYFHSDKENKSKIMQLFDCDASQVRDINLHGMLILVGKPKVTVIKRIINL